MYSLLLFALSTAISSSSSMICGVGVDWHGGDIVLQDIVSGSIYILETTNKNLNSLTRQGINGPFYTIGHQDFETDSEFTLFKYDPCNNTGLQTIGTGEVTGYDIRGLAYNPNDKLLYAIFFDTNTASLNKLYTINPNTVSLTYIANVSDQTETLEFDENGVLYGWSAINGLCTVDISTGGINRISTTSQTDIGSLQFLAFDPNDNNIIYVGFQSVYKVNKLNGTYTLTSYDAHSHRGFIILDQDICNQVQCNTDQPNITATNNPSQQPTIAPTAKTESLTYNSIDSPTLQATMNIIIDIILTDEPNQSIEEIKELKSENGNNFVSTPIIMIGIIIVSICCCMTLFCRRYHKRKIDKEVSKKNGMAKQAEMNHAVIKSKSVETSALTPGFKQCLEQKQEGINEDGVDEDGVSEDGVDEVNVNVIGVINSVPLTMTSSELSYNPVMSTYATDFTANFNKLNEEFVSNE